MKNRSHRYKINRPRSRQGKNIVNVKGVSVWWCLYVLSNTWATFQAKICKKVKQHWGWKKKSCIFVI